MKVRVRVGSVIKSLIHPATRRSRVEADWHDDVIRRLDELAQAQAMAIEAATVQIENMRPSKPAWRWAVLCSVGAAFVVATSAVLSVTSSNLDSQANTLNEQSLFNSSQANQTLVPLMIQVTQSGPKSIFSNAEANLATLKTAESFMRMSKQESVEADGVQSSAAKSQIWAQFCLAFGSALLGAMLGWIITQSLAVMRSKRSKPSPSRD